MTLRTARAVTLAIALAGATTACAPQPDGTAELVVEYAEAGSRTRAEVSIDDVACTTSDTGLQVRSGRSEGTSAGEGTGVLVVIVSDASPTDVLALELTDDRHFLSREPIEATDAGLDLEALEGYVVTGYLTDDEEVVADGATLSGTVRC